MEGQWSSNGGAMQGMEGMVAHCAPSLSARARSLSRPSCLSLSIVPSPPARPPSHFFLTLIFLSHTPARSLGRIPASSSPPSGMEGAMEGQWRGNGGAMQGMEGMEAHCAPSLRARALSLSLSLSLSPRLSLSLSFLTCPPAVSFFFFFSFSLSRTCSISQSLARCCLSSLCLCVCGCVGVWVCGCVCVCVCVLCVVDI